jgi:hypothetical protein
LKRKSGRGSFRPSIEVKARVPDIGTDYREGAPEDDE